MGNLMTGYYRAGGRPGSEEWWAKKEGYFGFRKNRDLSWKEVFLSIGVVGGVVAALTGILFWITG